MSDARNCRRLTSRLTVPLAKSVAPSSERIFMSRHQRNFLQESQSGFVGGHDNLWQPTSSVICICDRQTHGGPCFLDDLIGRHARAIAEIHVLENLQTAKKPFGASSRPPQRAGGRVEGRLSGEAAVEDCALLQRDIPEAVNSRVFRGALQ